MTLVAPQTDTRHMGKEFGEWLARAIERRGLDQYDLAARSGKSQPSISMYLSGARNPKRETVIAIGRALCDADAPEDTVERVVNEALAAGGFLPAHSSSSPVERLRDDQREVMLHRYDGLPPAAQKVVRELLDQLYDANRDRPAE